MIHRTLKVILIALMALLFLSGCQAGVLDPKGMVAAQEKSLLITAVSLMLIVVIPVFFMVFFFAWRYRHNNAKAKYDPKLSHSTILELIWWGIPGIIIIVLAIITWISTHRLDPYRPLDIKGKPLTIQAVSLDWKWLFIYPEQKIATVNYVQFPVNRQVQFMITSDAPMNSLQIPQLAGQIYAMAGMQSKLHLIANHVGTYDGRSVSYSGEGFSGMYFKAKVTTEKQFASWVKAVKSGAKHLDFKNYNRLAKPSEHNPVTYYASVSDNLFLEIIGKYMPSNEKKIESGFKKVTL